MVSASGRSGGLQLRRPSARRPGAARETAPRACFAGVGHQPLAQPGVRPPQLQVGDAVHALPRLAVGGVLAPARTQMVIEQLRHVRRHPGLGVHAVGDRLDRHLAEREVHPAGLHHAGGDPPVQAADRVAPRRLAEGQHGDVEILVRVVAVDPAHAHELLHGEAEFLQRGAEVVADERLGEQVEAGRDRGVGGEERAGAGGLPGLEEGEPLGLHEVAHALQAGEDRVPLVEMADLRIGPESAKRPGAADAEHQFLRQPVLRPAAVEFVGDPLRRRVVLGQQGVEQEQWDAAHLHPPHLRPDLAAGDVERDLERRAGRRVLRPPRRVRDGAPVSPAMTGLMGSVPKSWVRYRSRCQPLLVQILDEVAVV